MNEKYQAKPDLVNGKWRILVHVDGDVLHLGKMIDPPLMRYTEYDKEELAVQHIKGSDGLELMKY
jgi:hypothetical protein